MSDVHDGTSPTGSAEPSLIDISKWLIPSAGALLLVVGYIIQSAQDALLGFSSSEFSVEVYSNNAAAFLRDVIGQLNDFSLLGALWDVSHWRLITFYLVLAAVLILMLHPIRVRTLRRIPGLRRLPLASRALQAYRPFRARYLICLATLLMVAGKFSTFDSPLSFVNHLVLFNATSPLGGEASEAANPLAGLRKSETKGPASWTLQRYGANFTHIYRRARTLREGIVCSHLQVAESLPQGAAAPQSCAADHFTDTRTEFASCLLLQTAIATVCAAMIIVLRRSPVSLTCAAFGLAYALTVPYAYGKLVKDLQFDAGKVKLTSALGVADGVSAGAGPCHLYGLIVSRGPNDIRMLYANRFVYSSPAGKQGMQVRLLSLAASEVISIAEIESRDAIEWRQDAMPARTADVANLTAQLPPPTGRSDDEAAAGASPTPPGPPLKTSAKGADAPACPTVGAAS